MTDRAELRKRRILENSQKRLERITGRKEESNLLKDDSSNNKWESLINNLDPMSAEENFLTHTHIKERDSASSFLTQDDEIDFIRNETNIYQRDKQFESTRTSVEKEKNNKYRLSKPKIRFIVVCIFLHLVQIFTNNLLTSYFFLPLFILEITDAYFNDPINQDSKLAAILSLSNLPPQGLAWILLAANFIRKGVQDFAVYLFTYVIIKLLTGF